MIGTQKIPKNVKRLSDVEQARALRVFFDSDGDIKETYRALKKKVTLRTLKFYHKAGKWDLLRAELQSEIFREVLLDAKQKRLSDLADLAAAKARAKTLIDFAPVKTFGEATKALIDIIRVEREIIGNTDGADADVVPSILEHLTNSIKTDMKANGNGNGKNGNDHSSDDSVSGEIGDDDPFDIRGAGSQ